MGLTENPDTKPQIRMKRTGSSKPLKNTELPKSKNARTMVLLDGPQALKPWVEQTKRITVGLNCLDALKVRETIPRGVAPRSEAEWLRKLRTESAQHIVLSSITPAVFAYMRVLGYNSICGKNAAETYEYAKLAASRMHIPHNAGREGVQSPSEEEVDRMVWEWQFSKRESYPSEISYDQAMIWLKKMLERRAATDEGVREILETFEQRDKARRKSSMPLAESDAPEQPGPGKRKTRDDEAESPSTTPSPRQSEERQLKKPRSNLAHETGPLISRTKQSQAPGVQVRPGLTQPMPNPLPQQPDDQTTGPMSLTQLNTGTFPYTQSIGPMSISKIGGATREELLDTGLLTPRDLKSEPPEY
ncbi:hypothetical protein VMCG_07186 [Cytospora schulzeri]|uniref:Uncharacterized protein n=1 Tax=Cytospora schulzeri TaxID=448051 RepID=A0A423W4R4_9PEZI|nr:hypothetical protein VMCG_07186 [Valsa malicola]